MAIYSDLGGSTPVDAGLTEAEALLEAKKVSGYLGLLSPYYFGGVGTSTTIAPSQVNAWVDVNLTVDPAGTFDYRPQDMIDADATGFTGAGQAAQATTEVFIAGTINTAAHTNNPDFSLSPSVSSNYTVRFLYLSSTGLYQAILLDDTVNVGNSGGYTIDFSGPGGSIASGPTTITDGNITVDYSAVTIGAGDTLFIASDNGQVGDPYLFNLAGLTQQSFGKMRVTGLFTPDIDESQLDVRLLFTPNSSGTFGQFSIAEQAATMTQGAGIEYFVEPTITFFVGNTIEDLGSGDFGKFQLQIRSSVEGEFTLRGATMYIHS